MSKPASLHAQKPPRALAESQPLALLAGGTGWALRARPGPAVCPTVCVDMPAPLEEAPSCG